MSAGEQRAGGGVRDAVRFRPSPIRHGPASRLSCNLPSGPAVMSVRGCTWLGSQRGGEPLAEVVPAGVERADPLVFQRLDDVVVVDAEGGQFVEDSLRLVVGAVDAVVRDLPVAGDRVQ